MEWLKELEEQVARARREIVALRKQNRSLASQVKRLKREAQAASEAASGDWDAERDEVRERSEKIVSTLESILD